MDVERIIAVEQIIALVLYFVVAFQSIFNFKQLKTSLLKFFPLIAVFNLLIEGTGFFLTQFVAYNTVLYNFYNLPYFIFIFALFREASNSEVTRKVMRFFQIIIVLCIVIVSTKMNIIYENHYPVVVLGNVLAIISILLYYIEILQTDRVINIKYDTLFWISVGFLLFFIGSTPIEIIRNIFENEFTLHLSLYAIIYTLIIIMNICFIVGLLVVKPRS